MRMRSIARKLHRNLTEIHFTPDVRTNQARVRGITMKPTQGLEIHQVMESRSLGSCLNFKRIVDVGAFHFQKARNKFSSSLFAGSHPFALALRSGRWTL